ncbi:DUF4389 domain-containing protein [Kitasatospora aburaviensis]
MFFRLILVIPAAIIQGVVFAGWWMVALISWVVVLVLGRMPEPLFESTAAILRYRMRYMAYLLMLTPAYPKRLFGDEPGEAEGGPVSATRPLVLSGGGRGLLVVFIILGIVSWGASSITASIDDDDESKHVSGPLVPGPPVPGPFGRVPPGATR